MVNLRLLLYALQPLSTCKAVEDIVQSLWKRKGSCPTASTQIKATDAGGLYF